MKLQVSYLGLCEFELLDDAIFVTIVASCKYKFELLDYAIPFFMRLQKESPNGLATQSAHPGTSLDDATNVSSFFFQSQEQAEFNWVCCQLMYQDSCFPSQISFADLGL